MTLNEINKEISRRTKTNKEIAIEQLDNILTKFPFTIQRYISEAHEHHRIPKEYLFSSILNAFGTAFGTKLELNAMGYVNYPNIYTVIVGSRGDVKSQAIDLAFKPIKKLDSYSYDLYQEQKEAIEQSDSDEQTIRNQILIHNASIEKAKSIHDDNKVSIGLYHDEIMHLFEKMSNSKSRDGEEWKTFLLEGFTNSIIDIARVTSKSFRIEKGCPSLVGSIQTQLIHKVFENNNLESGFVDRLLFSVKLKGNNTVSKNKITNETKMSYSELLIRALEYRKIDETVELSLEYSAENVLHKYSQALVDKQIDSKTPVKEYISKLNIYIYKIAIIVHAIRSLADSRGISTIVKEDTIKLTIEIIEFYLLNFTMIAEMNYAKPVDNTLQGIISYAKQNGKSQADVVKFTGYSKGQISKKWR